MDYFAQQLINGLVLGSIYGLIAIGYTMVYGIVGMINFAHGDIFMIGGTCFTRAPCATCEKLVSTNDMPIAESIGASRNECRSGR